MKKILSIWLVLVLVAMCVPLGAFKVDAAAIDCLTYKVANGAITITGCDTSFSGEMIIPETIDGYKVKVIGESAFAHCASITNVVVPDSVLLIKPRAFSFCEALKSITLSDNVTTIDDGVFSSCENLTDINLPSSITSIGESAFNSCISLTNLVIPEGVEKIGSYAFNYCRNLISVTIPNTLQYMEDHVFYGCNKIQEVHISDILKWCTLWGSNYKDPDSVSKPDPDDGLSNPDDSLSSVPAVTRSETSNPLHYGADLYLNGEKITELIIPDGIESLGDYAFNGCTSIISVILPESTKRIRYNTFLNCVNIERVMMPGIESIDTFAFRNCENIKEVHITDLEKWCAFGDMNTGDASNHPTCYGADLYLNGEKVTNLVLPESLTKIHRYKFSGCSSYKSITLHKNVTYIGWYAFENCDNITKIIYYGTEEQWNAITKETGNDLLYLVDIVFATCDNHVYDIGNDNVCNICGEKGPERVGGDINGDDSINGKDAVMLMQYINNWPIEITTDVADVNFDGKINNKDYVLIVRYLNGWKI